MVEHDGHLDGDEEQHVEPMEPIEGVFTDLFAADMLPPRWVIRDLIPEGLTIIGAPPKSGKSTFELALALLVAGYDCKALPSFLSQVEETGPVMGFSAEATAGELRHMAEVGLQCKGPPREALIICDDPFMWRLDDPDGLSRLLHWLHERKPKLVFIDPLRDFHSLEEKDSGDMNRLLRPLQRWAKESGGSVVIVHHVKKKQGDDSEKNFYSPDDLRGTSALFGICDAVLMMTPAKDSYVRIVATFKRAAGWDRTFQIAAYAHAGQVAGEKLMPAERAILEVLKSSDAPKPINSISELTQIPQGRTQEALNKLSRNGLIRKSRGNTWKIQSR